MITYLISYIYSRLPILTGLAALPLQLPILFQYRARNSSASACSCSSQDSAESCSCWKLATTGCGKQTGPQALLQRTALDILLHSVLNQWEWERYSGMPKAQCYPFNLACHRFWVKNIQVQVFHVPPPWLSWQGKKGFSHLTWTE